MKQVMLGLLIIFAAISAPAQRVLRIGAPLPKGDLKMKDVSGNLVSLDEAKKENGLLVIFTCNTCPYVAKNQTRMKEICQYAQEKNIGVILLNSNEGTRQGGESYAEMQAYAKKHDFKWNYVVDSHNEIADAFGANRTPECFLFSGSGKLVYHGAIDNSPADPNNVSRLHLREAINEMLSGRDVSVKETRSVGCTIARKG
jgi:peroxiredoxin